MTPISLALYRTMRYRTDGQNTTLRCAITKPMEIHQYFFMVANTCMPNPVEGLLEVYGDIVEVLLVLEIFLMEASQVEDLLCGAPSCYEACLFFSTAMIFSACRFNLFSMIFSMTSLTCLMSLIVRQFWHCCRLPFLGSVMTKDWVYGVCHSPVCQILSHIVVRAVITSFPPAWTSSDGMLSIPADLPFLSDCTAASTSQRRVGCSSSVSVWGQSSTDGSPLVL